MKSLILIIILFQVLIFKGTSKEIIFPDDAVINILEYGINLNNGVIDATDAINRALNDHKGDLFKRKVIYFPKGIYLISGSIWIDAINDELLNGTGSSIVLQGAGSEYTTIRLKDYVFMDTDNPKPVLSTCEGDSKAHGWTNIAFMTSIFNLTVDVGTGNPGAIGIRFIANNQGTIRDVVVKSSDPEMAGFAGIDMARASIPGPAILKNVEVYGFDYGIYLGNLNYGMTLENLYIRSSRKAGILNNKLIVSARKVITENINGPSVKNIHRDGFMVLIDSDLAGKGNHAIENNGFIFLRNINSVGYQDILFDQVNDTIRKENIIEYVSHLILPKSEKKQSIKSLNLGEGNIPETPEAEWGDTLNWVNVADFGYYVGISDAGPAVNAAIDYMNQPGNESKNILYFPWGSYVFDSTIKIYGNVYRILFNYATIHTTDEFDQNTKPLITIENTNYPELFIERLNVFPHNLRKHFPVFLNNSPKDVVLKNNYIGHGKAYQHGTATGRLFIEDVCALSQVYYTKKENPVQDAVPQFDFGSQEVWARQLNTEQRFTHISTDGGQLWIFGIKTEEPGTVIHAKNNAKVELLGGTILPSFADIGDHMFILDNAEASITCCEHVSERKYNELAWYKKYIKSIQGEEITNLMYHDFPIRNRYGRAIPLYHYKKTSTTDLNPIDNNRLEKFNIYPNPCNSGFFVSHKNFCENITLEIYSYNGSILQTIDIKGPDEVTQVNLNLDSGTYLLKFNCSNKPYFKKLIVT